MIRTSTITVTDVELLKLFPEARGLLPSKLSEWKEEQEAIESEIKAKLILIKHSCCDDFSKWFWRHWLKVSMGPKLLEIKKQVARIHYLIALSKGKKQKASITRDHVELAKAIPINNLVESKLRKSGRNYIGLCPFHKERSPSFYIYTHTNTCWCFGCQQGGDSVKTVMLIYGYDFKEAVKYLLNNNYYDNVQSRRQN